MKEISSMWICQRHASPSSLFPAFWTTSTAKAGHGGLGTWL